MITRNASASVMQGSPRNGVATLRAPPMTEARNESAAFEPSSRPSMLGGLLEARLRPNGGAGAPRTAVWRSTQQLKLLPVAYKTVQNAAPPHNKTYLRSANATHDHAATRGINKEHGSSTY